MKLKCNKCGYSWQPRVDSPVACPRCKNYIDLWKKDEGDPNANQDTNNNI